MKNKLVIWLFILGFAPFHHAQTWRDSLLVAQKAYKKGDYNTAKKLYTALQKNAPNSIDLSKEIAQVAYKSNAFDTASKLYQQSASSQKKNIEKANSFYNLGNSFYQKKAYADAIAAYKASLRKNPNDQQARYNLSQAIRKLKKEEEKKNNSPNKTPNSKKDNDEKDTNQKDTAQKDKPKNNSEKKAANNEAATNKKMHNKSVERLLDQISKEEAETKRKLAGSRNNSNTINSGKDW
jgi:tetratricopeptide (TPR) repeat protein